MTSRSDIEDMMARIALRDKEALSALYDATSAKLFGICLHVLKNRSEAEDALQDVFIRIWHKADSYAVTGHSPMTWLITVARNLSIDKLRQRRSAAYGTEELAELADDSPGPEALAIASSERGRMNECMQELEPDRAYAVQRVYLSGDSYKELAEHFGVPLNTMRTWLRRSLLALKECLIR